MVYQIVLVIASFILSVISGAIIIPILRKLKVGQIERDDGPESHLKKQGTPTMGGIIMAIVTIILSIISFFVYRYAQPEVATRILPIVFITIGFGLIGFIDDFKKLVLKNTKGLRPIFKILGLLIIAVLYTLYLVKYLDIGTDTYIPILKQYVTMPIWLYIPFAIFVLLGTTNAVNLTDGVDGLASSVTAIIITCLTIVSIKLGVTEISAIGMILIGTCLGFLVFNIHPAKVFMGDTGSLLLGGAIAGMALYLKMPLLLVIIALIPIIETLSVMLQVSWFTLTDKRIFKMAPIHHHFELSGWKEGKVVSVFCIVTLIVCVLGLLAI